MKSNIEIKFFPLQFSGIANLFLAVSHAELYKNVFCYNLLSWGDYELWVFVCYQIALIFWIMHSNLKRGAESSIKKKETTFSLKELFTSTTTPLYLVSFFLVIIQSQFSLIVPVLPWSFHLLSNPTRLGHCI